MEGWLGPISLRYPSITFFGSTFSRVRCFHFTDSSSSLPMRVITGWLSPSLNLIERTNKMQTCSRIYYTLFLNCSETEIAASGFTYVFGCRPLQWLSHRSGRQPKTYVKPKAAITVFELLMVGGVSPETCWAIKKLWNNKFYYTVASCWFFLWDLYYDARIHEH